MADRLLLYGYHRSSCEARMRIALALKSIPYTPVILDMAGKEHCGAAYTRLNPSQSVPTLVHKAAGPDGQDLTIGQSIAGLEYLEEAFPENHPLLPREPAARAKIRQLVAIIASDTQPQTGSRLPRIVGEFEPNADLSGIVRRFTLLGLGSLDAAAKESAGTYSYGDEVTLADVVLAPACWNALQIDVDLGQFETVNKVFRNLMKLDSFAKSHYSCQPDTPEERKELLRKGLP